MNKSPSPAEAIDIAAATISRQGSLIRGFFAMLESEPTNQEAAVELDKALQAILSAVDTIVDSCLVARGLPHLVHRRAVLRAQVEASRDKERN